MLQPFNNITLEFKGKSSLGMQEKAGAAITVGGKNIDPIVREFQTDLYKALTFDSSEGTKHTVKVATSKPSQVVGILTEVFDHEYTGVQVMESGVISLIAQSAIAPGDPVGVQTNGKIQKMTTSKDKYFGVALTEAKADGDSVDVLLMIGGLQV